MSSCGSSLFSSFQTPAPKWRWESFAVSYAMQILALAAMIVLSILAPRIAPPGLVSAMQLVAPQLTPPPPPAQPVKIAKRPAPKPVLAKIAPPLAERVAPRIVAPPVPELRKPQRLERTAPVPEMARPRVVESVPSFNSKLVDALPGPKVAPKIVAVNTFGGSSAEVTHPKTSAARVQTGGFGDPNGVPASEHGSSRSALSAAGAFDLPQGSGHGNGGSRGVRGTVASAGFGNGEAVQGGGGRGGRAAQGAAVATSFSNAAEAATSAETPRAREHKQAALSAPVSIQSKPKPAYTPEARRLRIEGEVLLNVVFTADGKVEVLKVVRGLGHGLDESAQRAAKGIRFTPAMRNGHPVDSNVTLHIVFQLS